MNIPTEPIGSIPRSTSLLDTLKGYRNGKISDAHLHEAYHMALQDTLRCFEDTRSPVVSDGEQCKSSFATYPLEDLSNIAQDGLTIPFADGHCRQLPRLTSGPFRYGKHAVDYLTVAQRYTQLPVKQAVISASALSLLYPEQGLADYSCEQFLEDLVQEVANDIRLCLEAGAHCVQIDFTEGRLAVKLDPSKGLLRQFIDLNNRVLAQFSIEQKKKIGIHTCPGGDHDSTHSAEVDYSKLIPDLFNLQAGNFYMQLASEKEPRRVLATIKQHLKPHQRVFIGVINVLDNTVETPEMVRDRILLAAEYIPLEQLGTTDDCGFSPFEDDTSTGREIAFAKIKARILGTQLATECLSHSC